MAIFSTQFDNLNDLFTDQIRDLYDAEMRLTEALSEMAQSANAPALSGAFEDHLRQTQGHVARLEMVFKMLNQTPERKTCEGMKGLLKEGDEMVKASGDANVHDAGLIGAAQRVEHYEMAAYGTARTLAEHLGLDGAVELLQQTLEEEKATDQKLTQLAETMINPQAAVAP